jgi:hypothetical protein
LIFLRKRVTLLYPQALGRVFFVSVRTSQATHDSATNINRLMLFRWFFIVETIWNGKKPLGRMQSTLKEVVHILTPRF